MVTCCGTLSTVLLIKTLLRTGIHTPPPHLYHSQAFSDSSSTFIESAMEKYTIPIEKAIELTPVSSEPVRPFL